MLPVRQKLRAKDRLFKSKCVFFFSVRGWFFVFLPPFFLSTSLSFSVCVCVQAIDFSHLRRKNFNCWKYNWFRVLLIDFPLTYFFLSMPFYTYSHVNDFIIFFFAFFKTRRKSLPTVHTRTQPPPHAQQQQQKTLRNMSNLLTFIWFPYKVHEKDTRVSMRPQFTSSLRKFSGKEDKKK